MAEGIALQLTHTGLISTSVFISDVKDGVDFLNSFRKPGPVYILPNAVVQLLYTTTVQTSFELGAIRSFIDSGHLTALLVTGGAWPGGAGNNDLQGAYDDSPVGARRIVLANGATEGVEIRDNLASDADPIFAVHNNAGTAGILCVTGANQVLVGLMTGTSGILTDIDHTTSALGTNVGLRVNAEQTVSDAGGQIRGIRTTTTHSGAGTELVAYSLTGETNVDSGRVEFPIAGNHRIVVSGAADVGTSNVAFNQFFSTSSGTADFALATHSRIRHAGSGTLAVAAGAISRISNEATGTMTVAAGVSSRIDNAVGATIDTAYGLIVGSYTVVGTVTDARAIYIDASTDVGATSSYAILSDSPAESSLAGNLTVGGTSTGHSTLHTLGGFATGIESSAVDVVVAAGDTRHTILVDATAAPRNVSVPDATTMEGRQLVIKKIDVSANAVTFTPNAGTGDLVDGAATWSTTTQWEAITVQPEGGDWYITAMV